jgi:hypothetical protein
VPSSLIFAGLVVIWLLILVPAVARHRQEVARPTVAALSGRVLERPQHRPQQRRRNQEADMHEADDARPVTVRGRTERERPGSERPGTDRRDGGARVPQARTPEERVAVRVDVRVDAERPGDDLGPGDRARDGAHADTDRRWERPPSRYRPGRGGFDPEAAALAARARYAFRQRVVLTLLVAAVGTAAVAAVAFPAVWWGHAAVDVTLVGYLVYLRRQVCMEEAIRERRAARMAGTRRRGARGDAPTEGVDVDQPDRDADADPADDLDDLGPDVLAGAPDEHEPRPALARLVPAAPPALPPGTSLVAEDEDDPALHDLGVAVRPDHRRAVGE